MANHTSSEKRYRQTIKREERNRYYRTRIKNVVKAVTGAKSKEEASEAFKKANRYLHSMVSKGVLKKNTAARKVSRLSAFINKTA
ncbi:MAG: 30S ribosomal protein S20 [Helicobacteraceae bacterium]|jgi:small subunit ribosomal protein S20|nr:30S ribosomal protein S20 [Helicobacteraceae bacterium]